MTTIQYGIGKDYLKDWGVNEALREIYQNFIDYGTFRQQIVEVQDDTNILKNRVIINNDYIPNNLEFLQIGKSIKDGNLEAIGQHGEGLKMAMLIFLRLGYHITIYTDRCYIIPDWSKSLIGETLVLKIFHKTNQQKITFKSGFNIEIVLPKVEFDAFNDNLIKKSDILYTVEPHGSIVDKEAGNFYVGKLFVCKLNNLKKAYNLNPSVIKLDRDRRIPGSFETSWHTSKINEAQAKELAKFDFKDQDYDDMKYVQSIPSSLYPTIKPKIINNNLEFVAKTEDNTEVIIRNQDIKNHLKHQTFFSKAINGIKRFLVSKLGINDLLIEFRNKHCNTTDAKLAFDIILERLGIDLNVKGKEDDYIF